MVNNFDCVKTEVRIHEMDRMQNIVYDYLYDNDSLRVSVWPNAIRVRHKISQQIAGSIRVHIWDHIN